MDIEVELEIYDMVFPVIVTHYAPPNPGITHLPPEYCEPPSCEEIEWELDEDSAKYPQLMSAYLDEHYDSVTEEILERIRDAGY